jgi:hypothetical protein
MKIQSVIRRLSKMIDGKREKNKSHLFQQQRFLLHEGLETNAEVIDSTVYDEKVGGMQPVRLWVKLKKTDGSFIYTYTQTLVPFNLIPGKGQKLRIRYLPDNLSFIVILAIVSN